MQLSLVALFAAAAASSFALAVPTTLTARQTGNCPAVPYCYFYGTVTHRDGTTQDGVTLTESCAGCPYTSCGAPNPGSINVGAGTLNGYIAHCTYWTRGEGRQSSQSRLQEVVGSKMKRSVLATIALAAASSALKALPSPACSISGTLTIGGASFPVTVGQDCDGTLDNHTTCVPMARSTPGRITIPGVGNVAVTEGQPFTVTIGGMHHTFMMCQ
ncbi:uncharacterized protein PHACADRAFT_189558 [Phanerochaete carnosa HHB-10118-sp]|uniref:Uncharacterized protein n=1 Tax=Phanerochaete carnosa (strain HHB-10118-sp) TaxID=650164 RepID=K5WLX8_PHACS|nr:uncharacterized protein PHACADRAFT_189558 [Phanerochaete carnosa HHB-10118-sp]EKM60425.1 hypothetical protein PHACADRAFT_189558 [Phanerochaete carnosa HHB-10118-sp]